MRAKAFWTNSSEVLAVNDLQKCGSSFSWVWIHLFGQSGCVALGRLASVSGIAITAQADALHCKAESVDLCESTSSSKRGNQ
jgi:hypothetical protein